MRAINPALLALALAACGSDGPERITAAAGVSNTALSPVCVYFDVPAPGDTAGGGYGQTPGDVVFTENGIPVSVHTFLNQPAFGYTTVVPAFTLPAFGSGQIGHTNNINLGFNFSGVGFVTSSVTFAWRDYGGHENLKVNGSAVHVGELTAAPSPLGGAAVTHACGWSAGNVFKQGTTTVTGAVSMLGVGGQEFYLDNVCANP